MQLDRTPIAKVSWIGVLEGWLMSPPKQKTKRKEFYEEVRIGERLRPR